MSQDNIDITLDNQNIENLTQYDYIDHTAKLGKQNQIAEIAKSILLTGVFGKLAYILKNDVPVNPVIISCVLPVATYGIETMLHTDHSANRMRVTQKTL